MPDRAEEGHTALITQRSQVQILPPLPERAADVAERDLHGPLPELAVAVLAEGDG